jgi:hypothetical protein
LIWIKNAKKHCMKIFGNFTTNDDTRTQKAFRK